jgi:hypothetical protein
MYRLAAPAAPAAPPPPAPRIVSPVAGIQGSGLDMPQLQEMIATAFAQGNVTFESVSLGGNQPTSSPAAMADRLRRVDDLLEKGVLTEAEHREQRQRIIDSI